MLVIFEAGSRIRTKVRIAAGFGLFMKKTKIHEQIETFRTVDASDAFVGRSIGTEFCKKEGGYCCS